VFARGGGFANGEDATMSLESRLREMEQRAAHVAADVTAGAVEIPADDMIARDYADRLAARVAQLPQPESPTQRALLLTILSDPEALSYANGLARRLSLPPKNASVP
jgi:hypothetical protein